MRIFRVARESGVAWNAAKTAIQVVAVWGLLLVVAPLGIVALERAAGLPAIRWPGHRAVGLGVLLLASAGGLWSAFVMVVHGRGTPLPMDTARRLVVRGPYRYVRNPMAVFGLAQGAGVAILLGSIPVAVYVVLGCLVWQYAIRPAEERDLQARFGESYNEYRKRVRCWLPRTRR